MGLVTIRQALAHLKLPESIPDVSDLELKINQATAIVIRHIKRPDHGWTDSTDPSEDLDFAIVQAAILETVGDLYRNRGDEPEESRDSGTDDNTAGAFLKPNVRRKLHPLRSPSLA